MSRIFLSLVLIAVVAGVITFGATNAFFSDTETSSANTFAAGAIDLTVDNESYYNGVFNEATSWEKTDLTVEKFFNFLDVKPNDYGEDTISLHVATNDAYLCADVTLTSNYDNGCTEPEGLPEGTDTTCGDPGPDEGELAGLVEFLWWADDGDNVLEDDETVISEGSFDQLGVGNSITLALADSDENIWTGTGGAVPGNETLYIGKAWCFGDIAPAALATDDGDQGRSPADDNDGNGTAGEPEDGGIACDGSQLGNESQTDSLTADVIFDAVQARHNEGFQCEPPAPRTTLTLVKVLFSPDDEPTDWTLSAVGPTPITGMAGSVDVTNAAVDPGSYDLSESGPGTYDASLWNCVGGTQDDADTITLAEGESAICTIINYITCDDPTQQYADSVVSDDQGVRWDGTAIVLNRSDPLQVLGAPESDGSEYDSPVFAGTFFSLGFNPDQNVNFDGGKITVEFVDNFLVDGPGNDLRMWEVTGGTSYPVERLKIEVSQTGLPGSWYEVESSVDRDAEADLANSGLAWARYVRLTDVSDRNDFTTRPEADGYDLDAFSALTCADRTYLQP